MISNTKINDVWGHYHYDLVTTILRGEWGYKSNVITDWWMDSPAAGSQRALPWARCRHVRRCVMELKELA